MSRRVRFLLVAVAFPIPGTAFGTTYAYTDRKSYVAGDTIEFHVSTTSATYSIDIIRDSFAPQTMASVTALPGTFYLNPPQGWLGANWPTSYTLIVPQNWPTGSYYARFTEAQGATHLHPFAIRHPVPGSLSRIAYCMDYNTRNAYNFWGGKSLYVGGPTAVKVAFQRPFYSDNGLGKGSWLAPYCFGRIESEGYPLEYITEWDIHQNPGILQAYDILIFSVHMEYNSREFYDAIQSHHNRGGHMAFFSSNDLWWQVRYEDNGTMMVGYKQGAIPNDPMYGVNNAVVTGYWHDPLINRPSEALQGITFLNSSAYYQPETYKVQNASHWFFAGTGVQNGQSIGYSMASGETDFIGRASPPVVDILLAAKLTRPFGLPNPPQPFDTVAAIYYEDTPVYGFPNGHGGQVFSAGSMNFCSNMNSDYPDPLLVRRMLRNLLDHMLASPPPPPQRASNGGPDGQRPRDRQPMPSPP